MHAYLSHCHKQLEDLMFLPCVLSFSQGQESNKTGSRLPCNLTLFFIFFKALNTQLPSQDKLCFDILDF